MFCLDTYALAEIGEGNPKFLQFLDKDFVITDLTMAEYYSILYKDSKEDKAVYWHGRLSAFCRQTHKNIIITTIKKKICQSSTV